MPPLLHGRERLILSGLIADLGIPCNGHALEALDALGTMEHLRQWWPLLKHERANSVRVMRGINYRHVDVQPFGDVLGGVARSV